MTLLDRKFFSPVYLVALTAAVTVVLEFVMIEGCAGPSSYPRAISEEKDRYVRLEARYGYGQEGTAMRFSHPLALGEAEWARILEGTYVKPRQWFIPVGIEEAGLLKAFDESDRRYLSAHLSEAFVKARPDEWVVFFVTRPREEQVAEITSGGLFVEGDEVHLVLANYRQPVSMSFIQQGIRDDPLRPSGDAFYRLVPQDYQTLRTYRRWYPTKPPLAHPSELVIDYKALLNPTGIAARSESERPETANNSNEAIKLEEKLRLLQRLHEQGLITDQEYRLKRGKLLEAL